MPTTTNTIPMIFDRELAPLEGETLSLNIFSGYSDPQGDLLSWTLTGIEAFDPVSDTRLGSSSLNDFSVSAGGQFTYRALLDLAAGQQRTEIFNFRVFDGMAYTDTSVTVKLIGSGTAVTAPSDYVRTVDGQSVVIPVLGNDSGIWDAGISSPVTIATINLQQLSDSGPVLVSDSQTGAVIGEVARSGSDALLFTPREGFTGKASFTYGASYFTAGANGDTGLASYSASVVVDVLPSSVVPPSGTADAYQSIGLIPLVVDAVQGVLGNDSANGSLSRAQLINGPNDGTLDFNSDGSFTFTPSIAMMAAPFGSETSVNFTYKVFNGTTMADVPTLVTLTFVQTAQPLIAVDDQLSLQEDQTRIIQATDLFGADGNGPVNDLGTMSFSAIVIEAIPQHGKLLYADVPVSAGAVIPVSQIEAGQLVYSPDAQYAGDDTFQYRVSDGAAFSNITTVSLNIESVNDLPVTPALFSVSVNEGQPLGSILNLASLISDPDDTALGFRLLGISTGTNNGGMPEGYSSNYFSLSSNGVFSYDSRYLNLQPGQQQTEVFNYLVTDGENTSPGSFSITVVGSSFGGTPPAAPNDYAMTVQGRPVLLELVSNDTLRENPFESVRNVAISDITGLSSNEGSWQINPATSPFGLPTLVYTPAPGFTGDATFSYTLTYDWYREESSDVNTGIFSANATVRVVPDTSLSAPDGVADIYTLPLIPIFSIGTLQGVLVNDLAPSGGGIGAQLVSGPSQGTLDFNADGSFTYQASAEMLASAPGTNHQVTFTYRASNGSAEDSDTTLVTLNLRQPTGAPVAVNDVLNGIEDRPLVITPQSLFGEDGAGPQNDSQAEGQAFTEIRIQRLPGTGTLLLDGVAVNVNAPISVAQLEAGKLVFVPPENYSGSTSFDYIVRSNDGFSDPATVTLAIADRSDPAVLVSPPVESLIFVEAADATAQILSAPLGQLQFLDPDSPSLSASFSTLVVPSNPAIVVPPTVITALESAISFTQASTPSGSGTLLTISPVSPTFNVGPLNLDFLPAGEDLALVHRIIVVDDTDARSAGYDIEVLITGTNDAPVAGNIEAQILVDGSVAADAGLLAQVIDPDIGDSFKVVSVNNQPLGLSSRAEVLTEVGSLLISADGSYIFQPNPQGMAMARSESLQTDVTYVVADKAGATSTGTLRLTIWGTNQAPEAYLDQIGPVLAGGSTQFTDQVLLANDIDLDNGETELLELATFGFGSTVVAMPLTGSTTLAGTYGELTINANGQLSYAATTDASTALIKGVQVSDTFIYTITDPYGATSESALIVSVTGANRAPTAAADSYTLSYGQALTVSASSGVLNNDSDSDGDPLSAILQSGPSNGSLTLNANGSFSYMPSVGFIGTDSFSYSASDGSASSTSTQVSIMVQPPPLTLTLDKKVFINEIAVNAGAATITINTNNGALPDRVTTGVGRVELFNFSSSSISATDLAKANLEVVGLNAKLSVIGLDHLTGLTETAAGAPLSGVALQANGSLVLYEPNAGGIGIWQTYSASGTLLLSGTYQDNSWGLGTSVSSPIAINLVEQGRSIDFFAANGAPLSGLTDSGSTQTSLSSIASLASGAHAQGSITPFQLPDLSSPWFGNAQLAPSGAVIPNDVLSLLGQNAQFSGLLASSSDTVFARSYDRYLAATGGSDAAFVDYNDAGDWTYGGRAILTVGRENVLLSRSTPQFVANEQDAADDANPLQGYQPASDLIAGISNESGQTIAIYAGFGEGGRGHDFLYGIATDDVLAGNGGNDYLYGSDGNDRLEGGNGADWLMGGTGNDRLLGGSGSDSLMGGADSDSLIGGAGRDRLNGGSGTDTFIFRNLSHSTLAASDIIEDFVKGIDKIDLSAIDANARRAGDQAFVFAGRSASAAPNALNWFESSGNTVVQLDVDGNRSADMQIVLVGTNLGLTAADFVL